MKNFISKTIIFGVLIFLFSSCYWRSLHPLYSKKDLVMDSTLFGNWKVEEVNWEILKDTDSSYSISYLSEGKKIKFIGHLVTLGENYFLDLLPDRNELLTDYETYFEPVHSFSRIWIYKDSIVTSDLNYDWFKKKLLEKNNTLKFEMLSDERILLTSPTQEIQQFITKFANDTSAFKEKSTSYRIK